MEGESKFVQIVANDGLLTSLDEDGDVWTYCGNDFGWRPMNMRRMSDRAAEKAMRNKYRARTRRVRINRDEEDGY
jgi:hypothetical protein